MPERIAQGYCRLALFGDTAKLGCKPTLQRSGQGLGWTQTRPPPPIMDLLRPTTMTPSNVGDHRAWIKALCNDLRLQFIRPALSTNTSINLNARR